MILLIEQNIKCDIINSTNQDRPGKIVFSAFKRDLKLRSPKKNKP